jgi:hypothetical protein
MKLRRDDFRNYIRNKEGRSRLSLEEKFEGTVLKDKEEIKIDWVDETKVDLEDMNSCYSYLFKIENEV